MKLKRVFIWINYFLLRKVTIKKNISKTHFKNISKAKETGEEIDREGKGVHDHSREKSQRHSPRWHHSLWSATRWNCQQAAGQLKAAVQPAV